jgi:hypothetical protein
LSPQAVENETLSLLTPPCQEFLLSWLSEIYGKPVEIERRQLLRHRDLSYVERLHVKDCLPQTLIYKVVLPPWDIEKDLFERVLIPKVSRSPGLYLSAVCAGMTVLFIEDFGENPLLDSLKSTSGLPSRLGKEIAELQLAYAGRLTELREGGVLRLIAPADFARLALEFGDELLRLSIISQAQARMFMTLGNVLSSALAAEPLSLVHGDLYAENLLYAREQICIIDWSWFVRISAAILDLATLTMNHFKNGQLSAYRQEIIEAYACEYGRSASEIESKLSYAELASRLFFLEWLLERRRRGIMGTTVGPVDVLIANVVSELAARLAECGRVQKHG